MPSTQPIIQVDAFAERPFEGNPAAVCVLARPAPDSWMQDVAREMNLSETAFLLREDDDFRLRWFTPAVEVDLCGHATLASAHVLWTEGHLKTNETARFRTRSGPLSAERTDDGIEMNFPAEPAEPAPSPDGLLAAIGVERPLYLGRNRFDYMIEVESEAALRALAPDFGALKKIEARGFIATARAAAPPFDFASRFFAPACGVDEDPVTGSAHCALAPYWSAKLRKTEMKGLQTSARGGKVGVRLAGDRVVLIGRAVTILRGELLAPPPDAS